MSSRLFVAVIPPTEAIEDLRDFVEPRRDHNVASRKSSPRSGTDDAPLRWTEPEHWHITLAFLPSVIERCYDDLVERLADAARRRATIGLSIVGAGAYPDPFRAKVLWAGVQGDLDELARCATGARNAANAAGTEVDGGAFAPHVTLARVNRPTELGRWLQVFDTYRGPLWRAEEWALIESRLGHGPRGGAAYRTLEVFPLG
jgi:2'-5' RNA ligase